MNLIQTTEKLGRVKAEIADLKVTEEALKATLIVAAGQDVRDAVIDGPLFRSSVSFTDKRVVDYKAILALLVRRGLLNQKALDALVTQNTNIALGVPCVRVSSRKAA